jgi:hypothetical protein
MDKKGNSDIVDKTIMDVMSKYPKGAKIPIEDIQREVNIQLHKLGAPEYKKKMTEAVKKTRELCDDLEKGEIVFVHAETQKKNRPGIGKIKPSWTGIYQYTLLFMDKNTEPSEVQ